jgi:hypothetical protein
MPCMDGELWASLRPTAWLADLSPVWYVDQSMGSRLLEPLQTTAEVVEAASKWE